jgi:hypothetical protein
VASEEFPQTGCHHRAPEPKVAWRVRAREWPVFASRATGGVTLALGRYSCCFRRSLLLAEKFLDLLLKVLKFQRLCQVVVSACMQYLLNVLFGGEAGDGQHLNMFG